MLEMIKQGKWVAMHMRRMDVICILLGMLMSSVYSLLKIKHDKTLAALHFVIPLNSKTHSSHLAD